MDQHIGAMLFAVLFLGIMIGALLEAGINRPVPPTTAWKSSASLTRTAAESATAKFDFLPGGHLTANQIDCMCDALAAIDDAREDAPPGSPVRVALDRLHAEADALISASAK